MLVFDRFVASWLLLHVLFKYNSWLYEKLACYIVKKACSSIFLFSCWTYIYIFMLFWIIVAPGNWDNPLHMQIYKCLSFLKAGNLFSDRSHPLVRTHREERWDRVTTLGLRELDLVYNLCDGLPPSLWATGKGTSICYGTVLHYTSEISISIKISEKLGCRGTLLLISLLHCTDYTYQELICCELQLLGRQSVLKNVDRCR